jgi:SRSO17 transposase
MQDKPTWHERFNTWMTPFIELLNHKVREEMAIVYLLGLLGPGDRKSIQPMAERFAKGQYQRVHNFISASTWATEPFEDVHIKIVNEMVGGTDSHLIIDDTALVKQGKLSVGVAHQYCGQLGKKANCQCLVTFTLARNEIPVPILMKLYLPDKWCTDAERRKVAKVPETYEFKEKWRMALDGIDSLIAKGVWFGHVLADAGYGVCAKFRQGLTARGLTWAVGVLSTQSVYPLSVKLEMPAKSKRGGRPCKHPKPDQPSIAAKDAIAALGETAFQSISWRNGTKGPLVQEFAAVRARAADGEEVSRGVHLPGEEIWLVCERRSNGEVKYYFTNHCADAPLMTVVRAIKARWSCEQGHQQMKEELGLDHFECRSWLALSHHVILTMIAFAFLQIWRIEELHASAIAESIATPLEQSGSPAIELQEFHAHGIAESMATHFEEPSGPNIELPQSNVSADPPNIPNMHSISSRPAPAKESASKKAR